MAPNSHLPSPTRRTSMVKRMGNPRSSIKNKKAKGLIGIGVGELVQLRASSLTPIVGD